LIKQDAQELYTYRLSEAWSSRREDTYIFFSY